MPLTTGSTLGSYQVTGKLGAGGMGEVYRARDTKLNREVALKVLPEGLADDRERLIRFRREAEVLASLNHPNIAAIHGLEDSTDTHALVLELIEGPTLTELIRRGAPGLALDEALPIAKQIADALEVAHERGIVHRDLKPDNIKVRDDGTVKVLDFGLAKALEPDRAEEDMANSPTMTAAATKMGMIIGTVAYMSPEQAKGKSVDRQTDVWAFGCVLYEMLTGRQAFGGDSVTEILVAVMTHEPDLEALPSPVPFAVRRLIRRCLERDPKQRLRSVTDGLLHLDDDLAHPSVGTAGELGAMASPWQRALPWVAGAAVAVVMALLGWNLRPDVPPARDAFAVPLPPGVTLGTPASGLGTFALSPDGQDLVYAGFLEETETTQLYHRPMDRLEALPIPGTEGGHIPFFSPDGEWVGFYSTVDDALKRIRLAGGSALTIGSFPRGDFLTTRPNGVAWGEDDTIWTGGVGIRADNGGLFRVPASGGVPEQVTVPEVTSGARSSHVDPTPLPGGRGILYVWLRDNAPNLISVYIPATDEHRQLAEGRSPRYASSGHIVFSGPGSERGNLYAMPFDVSELRATGESVQVIQGARRTVVGADGTLLFLPPRQTADDKRLVWVDQDGTEEPIDAPPRPYTSPRVSPDGNRVALQIDEDVWVHDLTLGSQTPLTFDPGLDRVPLWTPDGTRIVFASDRDNRSRDLFWKAAEGSGDVAPVFADPARLLIPYSWSEDGSVLLITTNNRGTGFDVGAVAMDGEPRLLDPPVQTPRNEFAPAVSPDGRWIAYVNQEQSGRSVYISPFPDASSARWPIGPGYQNDPIWSASGDQLFYRNSDDNPRDGNERSVMAVTVDGEGTPEIGTPRVLFPDRYSHKHLFRDYDIAPDGRFIMIVDPIITGPPREITVIRNWVETLEARVPTP